MNFTRVKEPDRYSGCEGKKWRIKSDETYFMEV